MQRPAVSVQRAGRLQVAEVGLIAGGQDHGVDMLAVPVGPNDVVAVKTLEQRSRVGIAAGQGGAVAAVVEDGRGVPAQPAPERRAVDAGAGQPPVQVAAERALRRELQRRACGEADASDAGELGGYLDGAVAAADHDDALSREGSGWR